MSANEFETRAQTNLQLYRHLLGAGYSMQDMNSVRAAYRLAAQLFAGQLRPEGRPFVCHVVGVASILAMVESPPAAVIGGLLHSAYTHGDFGFGAGRTTRRARDRLRTVAGPQIERIVAGYASHPWDAAAIANWASHVESLDADGRQIALIHLANTIEDLLDDGLLLSAKSENPTRTIPAASLASLADALEYPRLAEALRRIAREDRDGGDLTPLRESHRGSYLVCPLSWQEKWLPRFARYIRHLRAGS
jgi:(p)ppGpp synthase/HD superfamily hydrolase